MRKLMLLVCLLLGIFATTVKGQPGIGCLRTSDGLLYTQQNILGYYEVIGNRYPTTATACPKVVLGVKTGLKCQFTALGPLNDEYNYVLYTSTGPVQCDLDQYGWGALALAVFFVGRRMRKI